MISLQEIHTEDFSIWMSCSSENKLNILQLSMGIIKSHIFPLQLWICINKTKQNKKPLRSTWTWTFILFLAYSSNLVWAQKIGKSSSAGRLQSSYQGSLSILLYHFVLLCLGIGLLHPMAQQGQLIMMIAPANRVPGKPLLKEDAFEQDLMHCHTRNARGKSLAYK